MKTILKLTLIAALLFCAISCQKTENATVTVSSDQAADIAASSLSGNSFGFSSITDNISANAQTLNSVSNGQQTVNSIGVNSIHQACGTTLTDSLTNTGSSSSVTFSYFAKYSRTLNCNTNNQPDNLINTLTFHGNFDGPRLTSNDSGNATVTIAGLTTNATNYVINGEYKRTGAFTSKVGDKTTGTSNIDIKATNVLLTKPSAVIASGNATITVVITTTKATYNFTGTLVFNGDGTANLTINNTVYVINLLTGVYSKK
jgi:hypothetical protein